MTVSACLVTRGDVDLVPPVAALHGVVDEIVVWNNGSRTVAIDPLGDPAELYWRVFFGHERPDLSVYGRYAAIEHATGDLIYVQDDDCVLPPESVRALVVAHERGKVVCNMPERFRAHYSDSGLVGFGAVFERDLPRRAFERYLDYHQRTVAVATDRWPTTGLTLDELREADAIFTTLTPMVWVDVPYENLPWATAPDRLYRQAEHVGLRRQMLELARQVRDA